MNKKTSRIIFKGKFYTACNTSAGLSVQSNRTNKGILIPVNHPQYGELVEAFDTAIDDKEKHNLAKGMMS